MAAQVLKAGVPQTCPMTCVDANGVTVPVPAGVVTTTSPNTSAVALSSSGQATNAQINAGTSATFIFTAADGSFSFSLDVSADAVIVPPGPAVGGSFGQFVDGTTP